MKRLSLFFILTLFASTLHAEQISENQAASIARKYLQSNTVKPLRTSNTTTNHAEYYIFNNDDNKGFVIISGDDELTELVAYSASGKFELNSETPSNITKWLGDYSDYVKAVRADKSLSYKKTLEVKATPIVNPLLTCQWNQGQPYNDQCPYDSQYKVRCPTGCAATAFAQVLYYWKWPEVGVGEHSYNSNYGQLSVDFTQSAYEWTKMKDQYIIYQDPSTGKLWGDWTGEEGNAVAKLMSDCGIAINMGYKHDQSGANDNDINYAAATYFQYDSEYYPHNSMSTTAFLDTIKGALNSQKPVLFGGQGPGGGHEFVVDGYDSNDFLHVNWGWGGSSDGYFDVNYMNPEDLGTGGGTGGGFSSDQSIVILTPNKTGDAKYGQSYLNLIGGSHVGFDCHVSAMQNSIEKGENLSIAILGIWNGGRHFKGLVSVAAYDMEGNRVTDPTDSRYFDIESGYFSNSEVPITMSTELEDLPDGKYRIYAVSREERQGYDFDWVRFSSDAHQDIEVNGNTITTGAAERNILEVSDLMVVKVNGEDKVLAMNDQLTITVTLSNPTQYTASGTAEIHMYKKGSLYYMFGWTPNYNIAPGQKTTYNLIVDLTTKNGFEDGCSYRVAFAPRFNSDNGIDFTIVTLPSYDCVFTIGGLSGVENAMTDNAVKLYPNPATDRVVVETEAAVESMSLYATDGRLVKQVKDTNEMNVNDCPAGYYVISIQTDKETINKQVIKK